MSIDELGYRFDNICKLYGVGDIAREELWRLMLEDRGEI